MICDHSSVLCSWQAAGVSIEGHPDPRYNGLFQYDSQHQQGALWPVLQNAQNMFCYHHSPTETWRLSRRLDREDRPGGAASIAAPQGPLPFGANIWRCWVSGKQQGHTLVVRLQVRSLSPDSASPSLRSNISRASRRKTRSCFSTRARLLCLIS